MDEAMQQTLMVAAFYAVGIPGMLFALFWVWSVVAKR